VFAILWERDGLWLVRRRADRLAWRVFAVTALALGSVGAFAFDPTLGVCIGLVLLGPAVAVCVKGRPGPSARLDLRARRLIAGGRSLRFEDVRAVRFATALHVHRTRYGVSSARQLWSVDLLSATHAVPVAEHPDEYALFRVARRIAADLGAPLLDTCGQEGTAALSPPGDPSAPGAHAVEPCTSQAAANHVELSWRPRCGFARALVAACAVALAAALALLGHPRMEEYHWAISIAVVATAGALVALARATAERCADRLSVGRDELMLYSRFPFPQRRRIPIRALDGVRMSQVLLPIPPTATDQRARLGSLCVDVLGQRGRLLRIPLPREEAVRLHAALEAAVRDVRGG
jgi:hypothetical protein